MFLRRVYRRVLTACFARQAVAVRLDSALPGRRLLVEPLEDMCPSNLLLPLTLPLGAIAATAVCAAEAPADAGGLQDVPAPSAAPPTGPATAAVDAAGGLLAPISISPMDSVIIPAAPLTPDTDLSERDVPPALGPAQGTPAPPDAATPSLADPVAFGGDLGALPVAEPASLAAAPPGGDGFADQAAPPARAPVVSAAPVVGTPANPSPADSAPTPHPTAPPTAASTGPATQATWGSAPAMASASVFAPDLGDPGLMGLSQASLPPDIASGGVTRISYTQLGNNLNPFQYSATPMALLLGDGRRFTLGNPSTGGARSTQLNMFLFNDGSFATGAASGTDFTITGKVTIDGNTFDNKLLTGKVRGFGWQVNPTDTQFEVRIGITGGSLTDPAKGYLKIGGEMGLLIHQPGLPIGSFPRSFNYTNTTGSSDARKMAEVFTNSNPVAPSCGCNQSDVPPAGTNGDAQDTASNSVYMNTGEFHTSDSGLDNQGRKLSLDFQDAYRSGIQEAGPLGHNWDFNYDLRLIQVNAENIKEIHRSFPSAKTGDVVRVDAGEDRTDIYTLNPDNSYTDPHGFFTQLVENGDGTFRERDQYGNIITFAAPDKTGRADLTSESDPEGNTLTFQYNSLGQLSTATDPFGRMFTYSYNAAGELTTVTDYDGRSMTFTYDALGELADQTTPAVTGTPNGNDFPGGKTTQYTYSEYQPVESLNHEMTSVTSPNEVADGGSASTTVIYDTNPFDANAGRVMDETEGGTDYTGVPAGGVIQYTYLALVSSPPADDVGTPVSQTTVTNRNGDKSQYQFNELGSILQHTKYDNRGVSPGDAASFTTTYTYDSDYHVLKETMPQGNTVTYTFDSGNSDRFQQGNLLSVTQTPDSTRGGDQAAVTTTYTYEPIYNQVHTVTEPRGNDPSYVPQNGGSQSAARYTTTYTYDYQEDSNFAGLAAQIGGGITAPQVQARLAASGIPMGLGDVNGDGRTDQIHGNLIRTHDPTVTLVTGSNEAAVEGTTSQPVVTLYTYNDFGQMTSTTDAEGNVTAYSYYGPTSPGPSGGPIFPTGGGYLAQTVEDSTSAPGRDSGTNPPPAAITDQYQYDAVGNITRQIDGRGIATDYVYNQLNEMVQKTEATIVPGVSSNEPLPLIAFQYQSRIFYDYNDNIVLSQVEDRGSTSIAPGNPPAADLPFAPVAPGTSNPNPTSGPTFQDTVYKYDILDQRVESLDEVSNGSSPEFLDTRMRYDPNGNPVLTVMPEGNATAIYYDERDFVYQSTDGATSAPPLTELAPSDPTSFNVRGGLPATTTDYYDLNGNLIESVAPDDSDGSQSNNSKHTSGTSTGGDTSTTLSDTSQGWMTNQWQGRAVLIVSGTDAGDVRVIASNTATTLAVSSPWTTTPDSTSVYAFQGDRTRYQYDGFDRQVSMIDSVGNETVTQYDPDGQVIRSSSFGPVGGPSPTGDGPDTLSQPVSSLGVIQPTHLVNSNLLGATEYLYDELGRQIQTSQVLFVNTIPTARPADVAEGGGGAGLGNASNLDLNSSYEGAGYQTQPIPGVSGVTILGRVEDRTEYDRDSRVTFNVQDDLNTTRTFYDGVGRVIESNDGALNNGYDAGTNSFNPTNLAGNTVETAYDADSNVIETRQTDVSQVPGIASEIFLTTNFYDSLNRLQQSVDNLGRTTYDRYDSRDNVVATADADGPFTGGSVARRAFPDGPRTVDAINGPGNVTRYFYDGVDRNIREEQTLTTTGQGDGVHFGASIYGVKDDPTAPDSFTPPPDPTQGGGDGIIRTGIIYDKNSLQSALIDDNGNVTVYTYDDLDRQVTATGGLTVNSTLTGANFLGPRPVDTPTAETINNPASIPTSQLDTQLAETDARLLAVASLFPSLANQVDDHPPTTTIEGYDPKGNVLIRSDENNSYTYSLYDAIDRPIAVRIFRAGQADSFAGDPVFAPSPASLPTNHTFDDYSTFQPVVGTTIENFQYDGLSRVTYAFDNNGPGSTAASTMTDGYDSLSRVIEETQQLGSTAPQAIDSAWRSEGLRKSLTYPNGRVETYTYDNLDRLATVADQGVSPDIADYKYIGEDRVLERDYPINGTRETYLDNSGTIDVGYDGLGRPVEMRDLRNDNSVIVGFTYTYDRMSNKLTEGKLHDPANTETYAYDSAYRLISFQRPTGTPTPPAVTIAPSQASWKLDGVGNWDSLSNATSTETRRHSSFNEIISRTTSSTTTPIVTDDNGNETNDGTYAYTYDAMNRLRTVTRNSDDALIATYSYDAEGRRIQSVITNSGTLNGTTDFYLDGDQEIEEHAIAGAVSTVTQQYVYGDYIDEPLVVDGNLGGTPARYFYYQNSLYSVYALADTGARIVEGYLYDAYGRQTVYSPGVSGAVTFTSADAITSGGSSKVANPYLFTGRRLDAETNLYYYRARFYDTTEGRFLSRDPGGFRAGMNRYAAAFVPNALDPSGREIITDAPIDDYLANSDVKGYTRTKLPDGRYKYSGVAKFDSKTVSSEILGRMINSPRKFEIAGKGEDETVENIKQHVAARQNIVEAAKDYQVKFDTDLKLSGAFWQIVKGEMQSKASAYDALEDVFKNPADYQMACRRAARLVMLWGIAQAVGKEEFDKAVGNRVLYNGQLKFMRGTKGVPADDWIPGDWGYIKSQAKNPRVGEEGENIIYLGNGEYWGQGPEPRVRSLEKWQESVAGWSGAKDKPPVGDKRDYPSVGLR
jgi:RHS repeat-associated protein